MIGNLASAVYLRLSAVISQEVKDEWEEEDKLRGSFTRFIKEQLLQIDPSWQSLAARALNEWTQL